jgi:hypothetical protein
MRERLTIALPAAASLASVAIALLVIGLAFSP